MFCVFKVEHVIHSGDLCHPKPLNTEKLREEELNYDKLHTSVFADKVVDLLNPRDNQVVLNVNQGIWIAFFILSCGGLLSSNTDSTTWKSMCSSAAE